MEIKTLAPKNGEKNINEALTIEKETICYRVSIAGHKS